MLKINNFNVKFKELFFFKYNEINLNNLNEIKKNLNNSIFIDKKIINTINNFNIIRSFELNINNDIIFLNIVSNKEIKINFIKKIIDTIVFFRKIDINFPVINLTINLFLTNYKKKFPSYKSINYLGISNVNTGFTTFYNQTTREINLYRKEEINKVLIHELIHAYNIDEYYIINHEEYSNKLSELYNIKSINGLRMYESYTESLAIIIHSIKISIEKNISINKIINDEINFSLGQIENILNFYNINNLNELKDKKKELNEESSIFSYYIIKGSLLNNINEYLTFLNKNNINYFSLKTNNISEFYKLIIKSLKKIKIKKKEKKINNILRMSIHE